MNKGQKVLAGLLGVVAVELDSEEKMEEAMNVALEDMIEEGE